MHVAISKLLTIMKQIDYNFQSGEKKMEWGEMVHQSRRGQERGIRIIIKQHKQKEQSRTLK